MPTKANKYCSRCSAIATSGGYCEEHKREQVYVPNLWQGEHKQKPISVAIQWRDNKWLPLYGTSRWKGIRKAQLRREPLCAVCMAQQRLTPATVCDHITPHQGDLELFHDPNNWQSLCTSCHCSKTAREDGGFGNAGEGMIAYPYDIPKPLIPLTIVCGSSCSGKSTYIEESKGESDYVIDVDVIIAELSGLPLHESDSTYWLKRAILERNNRLAGLSNQSPYNMAWLISASPRRWQRDYWRDRYGAKIIVIVSEGGKAECITRGDNDKRRNQGDAAREIRRSRISKWWAEYEPDAGDYIISNSTYAK